MRIKAFFSLLILCTIFSLNAEVFLNPPKGWECINDPEQLPQKILRIYIGPGKNTFTPSINISSEETTTDMNDYFNQAKIYHEAQPRVKCSKMGVIQTKSGPAPMLQIDSETQWGNVRFIQAFVIKNSMAYVVTATCLQEDFSTFSPQFFKSLQSFMIN